MPHPRILINLVSLSGGALMRERHVLSRLSSMVSDAEVHILCPPAERSALDRDNLVVHEADHLDGTVGRMAWENVQVPRYVGRLDVDLLYFPLHVTNLLDRCPKVSAVRNVAPFYPEAHRGASWRERCRLSFLRRATKRTIAGSERVVFMTAATKERVAKRVPAASEKGTVIPHGVPDGFAPIEADAAVLEEYDLPESYLLSVSNVVRYKNLVELVDGYARARSDVDLPPLCIAGKVVDERYAASIWDRISAHGLEGQIRLLGYIDHDDLPHLHAASDLFVFSSACENAPLSLIEALACGDAIATSEVASMPEICGDAAAYFDPYDPAAIGDVLADLWTDAHRRDRLSELAIERATNFHWDRTARKTGTLLSELAR
jgi:glycosyltransferase involved in cell wall biosynthesis